MTRWSAWCATVLARTEEPIRPVASLANDRVKRARALRDKKGRRREGLFLAEGWRILIEARDAGVRPAELWVSDPEPAQPLARALIEEVGATGAVYHATADVLGKLSGKDNPQTAVGVFADLPLDLDRLDRTAAPLWLVAERLRDPGNLGTLLRTADAVGAGALILLDECADPFSVEAVRASMGAVFTVPVARASTAEFHTWMSGGPGCLIGLSLRADSVSYTAVRYEPPVVLLVGNEARGLPPELEDACDRLVSLPMLGRADSLNAAVAGAVAAYEVLRQWDNEGC